MKQDRPNNSRPRNNSFNKGRDNSRVARGGYRERPCPDDARHAAAKLVWEVLENKTTLDEAMNIEDSYNKLLGRDRGFAAYIAKSVFRYLGPIDKLIAEQLKSPLPDTAYYARALLRCGVAQYLANLAPVHAIVGRAVDLAKADKVAQGMSGLINAVLRKIVTNETLPEINPLKLLPNVWINRYINAYGTEKASKIAASILNIPPIDFSIDPTITEAGMKSIAEEYNAQIIFKSLRSDALIEGFTQTDAWQDGNIWVQDVAASLPALILKPKQGDEVLDMCAAPGGKTIQLCKMGAKVTALDNNEERLKITAENIARTNTNAKLLLGDARQVKGEYDAILLDAPCSASGTMRRNLESPWIKTPNDLPKFIKTQSELMIAAIGALKTGGKLVYSVCSLEPEEAEIAIATALENGLVIDKISAEEVGPLADAIEDRGTMRILPYMLSEIGGIDGFFIARFIKK